MTGTPSTIVEALTNAANDLGDDISQDQINVYVEHVSEFLRNKIVSIYHKSNEEQMARVDKLLEELDSGMEWRN